MTGIEHGITTTEAKCLHQYTTPQTTKSESILPFNKDSIKTANNESKRIRNQALSMDVFIHSAKSYRTMLWR